jgi:thiamine biosynthesis lipoprotein
MVERASLKLWFFALVLLLGVSPGVAQEVVEQGEARFLMGTMASVTAWAPDADTAALAASAARDEMSRVEAIFSTWRPTSEITLVNRLAGHRWVTVSEEFLLVLHSALDVAQASDGAFDPTILPLVKLWGFRSEEAVTAPADSLVARCLEQTGFQQVQVDSPGSRVRFLKPGVELDFGGIAKGHALDQAARIMRANGAVAGRLDLGGGVLVFGTVAESMVGIVDPSGGSDPLGSVRLADASMATSGQYERYRESEGRRWGHILDPRTGCPSTNLSSVTVMAESAMLADAAATACFVLGREKGRAFLEGLPGCEGIIVFPDEDGLPALVFTSGL